MINFCKILLNYDDFDDLYFVYYLNFLFMMKYLYLFIYKIIFLFYLNYNYQILYIIIIT